MRGVNSAVIFSGFYEVYVYVGWASALAFFNHFLVWAVGLGLAAALVLGLFPEFIWRAGSSFSPVLLRQHRAMLEWSALLLFCSVSTYFLTDLLSACRVFTRPLLGGLVAATFPLIFVGVDRGRHGVVVLLAGAATSTSLYAVTLGYWAWTMVGWRPWRIARARGEGTWRDIGFAQLGNVVAAASSYVVLYLFSGLGAGVVSAFSYARTLANIPQAFLVDHISSFVGLKFSELLAMPDWTAVNRIFRRALLLLGFLLWPLCFGVWVLRRVIVDLLFHFRPQTAAAHELVAGLLAFLILAIPFAAVSSFVAIACLAA